MSKATLRPDLAILKRAGIICAKPKVGYYYDSSKQSTQLMPNPREEAGKCFSRMAVHDWMGVPAVISTNVSAFDASAELFMRDVGSLFITDEKEGLVGIVSRKDLLRVAIGGGDMKSIPITMIMSRKPNLIFVFENDSLFHAAKLMKHHEIDSLPVVEMVENENKTILKVVGRITKTTIVKALVSLGE